MSYREIPFKRVLARNEGGVWGDEPVGEGDFAVMRSTDQNADGEWLTSEPAMRHLSGQEARRFRLRAGDLLLTKSSGSAAHIGKCTLVDPILGAANAAYSNFMQRLTLATGHNPRYYWYVLRSKRTKDQWSLASTTTTGLANLNSASIGELRIPAVSKHAQDLIVDFLDRETAEIEAFIADQEKLITLLTERRAATISHAVTKGLDPNASMKDTGAEWLGKLPAHWVVTRLSRYFSVTLGKMLDEGKTAQPGSTSLPYIRAANIQEDGLNLSSVNEMPFSLTERAKYSIRQADVLVVEGGAIGVNVFINDDMPGWAFQKTVNRLRPRRDVNKLMGKMLSYILDSYRYVGMIDMLANKSTIAHFTAEKLERLVIPFPPCSEVCEIIAYLDRETAEMDAAIADARDAIALLREKRAALISAAVTGKIDVRDRVREMVS